jgi:2'-5' RNA ligase
MPSRCFLGITLPGSVVRTLGCARETFVADAPSWAGEKWVAAALLHVTVAFLGPVDDPALDAGVLLMRDAIVSTPAFELRLAEVVAVPSPRGATMLWATLNDPDGRLTSLRDGLAAAFPSAAVDTERPLRPHVTLVRARSRRRVDRDALADASTLVQQAGKDADGVVSVRSVTLFSSALRPAGPEYREIAVAELAR